MSKQISSICLSVIFDKTQKLDFQELRQYSFRKKNIISRCVEIKSLSIFRNSRRSVETYTRVISVCKQVSDCRFNGIIQGWRTFSALSANIPLFRDATNLACHWCQDIIWVLVFLRFFRFHMLRLQVCIHQRQVQILDGGLEEHDLQMCRGPLVEWQGCLHVIVFIIGFFRLTKPWRNSIH